jgi:hypothetical protein
LFLLRFATFQEELGHFCGQESDDRAIINPANYWEDIG